MLAVVLRGPGDIALEDVARPELQSETDVILKVTATSICTSDVHYAEGFLPIEEPFQLGHEFVGTVVEAGSGVRHLRKGDRVAVSPYAWCGGCEMCRKGLEAWCTEGALLGSGKGWGDLPGGLSEFVRVPYADTACVPVPPGVTDEQAAVAVDAFATGLYAIEQCNLEPGQAVAIFGAGPIGLSAVQAARLYSPARIFLVDLIDERLELGATMGATDIINASRTDPVEAIRAATGSGHPFLSGVDAAADCVGLEQTVDQAAKSITKGGILSIVGVPKPGAFGFDLQAAQFSNLTVRIGMSRQRNLAKILGLTERGEIDLAPLVTHVQDLADFESAFAMFADHGDGCLKVVLKP